MSFNELGLNDSLLQAVNDSGYTTPTPIQLRAIPAILTGKDIMAAAQTGTGKTAGFTLPMLQMLAGKPPVGSNQTRALILTPTRELAAQIQESIETYGKHDKVRSVVVFGGVNINPQMQALRKGCDILVATPGRLLDLYQQNAVKFNAIEILVLDEADRMLDMGFIRDIRKIIGMLPKQRQNLMFSATFSDEIRTLAKTICHQPIEIDVAPRNSTVDLISQRMYQANKDLKLPLLAKILLETPDQVLVFNRTKHGANNLVKKLAQYGVASAAIHGNKSQSQRTKALADFKSGKVQVLLATDIAARGIDIDQLAMVINYEMPQVPEDYIHRIGRTGRAGSTGIAISLVADDETAQLRAIERLIKRKIEKLDFDRNTLPARKEGAVEISDERGPRPSRSGGGRQSGQPRGQRQGNPRSEQRSAPSSPSQSARRQGQERSGTGANSAQPRQGQSRQGQPRQQGQGRSGPPRQGRGPSQNNRGRSNNQSRPNQPRNNQPRSPGNEGDDNRGNTTAYATHNAPAANSFWRKLREAIPGLGN
jgi:ATP-dependent RNA helicase RhlE